MSSFGKEIYKFDRFQVDAGKRLLFENGEIVALTPKAFDTLLALVESQGNVVSKDVEIMYERILTYDFWHEVLANCTRTDDENFILLVFFNLFNCIISRVNNDEWYIIRT